MREEQGNKKPNQLLGGGGSESEAALALLSHLKLSGIFFVVCMVKVAVYRLP